jgi:hypothetical protein
MGRMSFVGQIKHGSIGSTEENGRIHDGSATYHSPLQNLCSFRDTRLSHACQSTVTIPQSFPVER